MAQKISARAARELLAVAGQLAEAAAEPALRHFRTIGLEVKNKDASGFDPVTAADRESELAIREALARIRPDDGIIGEEFGNSESRSGLTWVIDPIDGTRSFIAGFPLWTILIGLQEGTRPVLGVIDQPYIGERYWGITNDPTRESGFSGRGGSRRMQTRSCTGFPKAVIATTHPDAFATASDCRAFRTLETECRLSRHGGDAYQYALLADGHLDLVVESGLQAYDVAALIPVVEGAGGVITGWDGSDCAGGGRVLAAGCREFHQLAMAKLATAGEAQV